MSNSILITGINGFVGTNFYNNFKKKINITGIDISSSKSEKQCTIYTWDEFSLIPEVDTIIHLAGLAHDTNGTLDESKYFDINVGLTKQIFDHFLNSSAQKFIFFSSVKAVADSTNDTILTEATSPDPKTPYGKSKLEAENYIRGNLIPNGKQVYILRPAMIHGPGNKGNLNLLYSILKRGIPYPLGAFHNERSFTSIQNLLFLVDRLVEEEVKSGIYNVCDDESVSTITIAKLIYESLGKPVKIWNISKGIIETVAHVGDMLHLPLNSERLKKMTESYVVSNHKIKEATRISSLPVNANSGLSATFASFLNKQESQ